MLNVQALLQECLEDGVLEGFKQCLGDEWNSFLVGLLESAIGSDNVLLRTPEGREIAKVGISIAIYAVVVQTQMLAKPQRDALGKMMLRQCQTATVKVLAPHAEQIHTYINANKSKLTTLLQSTEDV
jgi:hypothetical protein